MDWLTLLYIVRGILLLNATYTTISLAVRTFKGMRVYLPDLWVVSCLWTAFVISMGWLTR